MLIQNTFSGFFWSFHQVVFVLNAFQDKSQNQTRVRNQISTGTKDGLFGRAGPKYLHTRVSGYANITLLVIDQLCDT